MSETEKKEGVLVKAGRRMALIAGGTGIGLGLGFAKLLFDLYKSDRAIGLQVIDSAPLVIVILFGMGLLSIQWDRFISTSQETAGAMHEMANANRQLAAAVDGYTKRDEERADAQQAAIGYVAQKQEEMMGLLHEIKKRLPA